MLTLAPPVLTSMTHLLLLSTMGLYSSPYSGQKIGAFLEEAGLPYKAHVINIMKNEQFQEDFLKISVRDWLLRTISVTQGIHFLVP